MLYAIKFETKKPQNPIKIFVKKVTFKRNHLQSKQLENDFPYFIKHCFFLYKFPVSDRKVLFSWSSTQHAPSVGTFHKFSLSNRGYSPIVFQVGRNERILRFFVLTTKKKN